MVFMARKLIFFMVAVGQCFAFVLETVWIESKTQL